MAAIVLEDGLVEAPPPWYLEAAWILLAALASMTLLAFTSYLSTDIAPSPFMWVVPLSLYLLSFIICFDREIWYFRPLWGTLGVVLIGLACAMDQASDLETYVSKAWTFLHLPATGFSWSTFIDDYHESIKWQAALYMAILFCTCMLCHGEIVKSKPAARYLTRFYLMVSLGGALGGIFVGLICPIIFTKQVEIHISIVGTFVVGWVALLNASRNTWMGRKELLQWSSAFVVVGFVFLIGAAQLMGLESSSGVIVQMRNFYGTIWVKEITDTDEEGEDISRRSLYHGRILHGTQYTAEDRADEATTYYDDAAGPGIAVPGLSWPAGSPTNPRGGCRSGDRHDGRACSQWGLFLFLRHRSQSGRSARAAFYDRRQGAVCLYFFALRSGSRGHGGHHARRCPRANGAGSER